MNLSDFFRGTVTSLPRGGFETANCTFDVFLRRLFSDYVVETKKIHDPDYPVICEIVIESIPEIERISRNIVAATKNFLQGYPHQAYQEIRKTLKGAKFDSLLTVVGPYETAAPHSAYNHDLESIFRPAMYRMRPNFGLAAASSLKKSDIFHVPFENRNLVRNQRYSVAGLPCLYLGSSAWICWEELNRPELNDCICSRFKFAEASKILDFQVPPAIAWNIYSNIRRVGVTYDLMGYEKLRARYTDEFIISYILYWPLIAASSIRVDSRTGAFFPQYIIPQLLLQWVTKEGKVDGIRYFSSRSIQMNHYVNVNYVFPTRDIKYSGRCSTLQRKIHLVNPVPWALVDLIKKDPHELSPLGGAAPNWSGLMELSNSMTYSYHLTKFHDLEDRLADLENQNGSGPVED